VFWHLAPADALLQQYVLRAEIGHAPGLGADYTKVPALCEWRAVRQHKLEVIASGAAKIATVLSRNA
jgi:hypothetical protein